MFGKKSKRKGTSARMSSSALRRSCESLYANIRFTSVDGSARAICVTSSGENEGKSTVCTNLASTIAASGKKVLLVECDMRRRSLAYACGTRSRGGLYAVLSGQKSVSQVVSVTPTKGVWLLDCEPSIPNPPDILSSSRFAALIRALRRVYDYVIVDTPPLGAFVDAAMASRACDGTIFVVRERSSRRVEVHQCLEQLETAGVRVLGLVTTFARSGHDNSYYRYYEEGKGAAGSGGKASQTASASVPAASVGSSAVEGDFEAWAQATGIGQYIERPKAPARSAGGAAIPQVLGEGIGRHSAAIG